MIEGMNDKIVVEILQQKPIKSLLDIPEKMRGGKRFEFVIAKHPQKDVKENDVLVVYSHLIEDFEFENQKYLLIPYSAIVARKRNV